MCGVSVSLLLAVELTPDFLIHDLKLAILDKGAVLSLSYSVNQQMIKIVFRKDLVKL